MFDSSIALLTMIDSLFGLSDYCYPKPILEYMKSLPFGRYSYGTSWMLCLTLATTILFFIKKLKIASSLFKIIFTTSLCGEIFVAGFFWSMFLHNPMSFVQPQFEKQKIFVPFFNELCLHLFPVIGLLLLWINNPIYTKRIVIFTITILIVALYALQTFVYKNITKEWVYPFMNKYDNKKVLKLTLILIVILIVINEILIRVEKRRKIRRINISKKRN